LQVKPARLPEKAFTPDRQCRLLQAGQRVQRRLAAGLVVASVGLQRHTCVTQA
jgi:hypothetical protein